MQERLPEESSAEFPDFDLFAASLEDCYRQDPEGTEKLVDLTLKASGISE